LQKFIPNRLVSISWMFAWASVFSITMALVKCLENTPTTTVVFVRFLCATLLMIPFLLKQGKALVRTERLPLHLLNVLFRCGAIGATYYVYAKLPLAFATALGFTGPMIAVLLALFILRERVGWQKWLAIILGYGGVLIMVQPEHAVITFVVLIALFDNLCAGMLRIVSKKLMTTDSPLQIMVYTNVLCFLVSACVIGFVWQTPPVHDWSILVAIGLGGTLSQFAYIKALQFGQVSLVAPFEYSRLLFALPIGFIFFQEVPTSWQITGSLIIVACSAFLTWYTVKRTQPAEGAKGVV